jgi:shikimate dehydrogenase
VVVGLEALGAEVVVVARRPDAVTWRAAAPWAELPALLPTAALLVDATSAALDPTTDAALAAAVPLAALPADATVATLIYHRTTALLAAARARGHATVDGRAMLLYQATRAFTLWTGRAAPIDVMAAALAASLA